MNNVKEGTNPELKHSGEKENFHTHILEKKIYCTGRDIVRKSQKFQHRVKNK